MNVGPEDAAAALTTQNSSSASAAAGGPHPFSMLVGLSIMDDSFLGFDSQDVLELQSLNVSMTQSGFASAALSAAAGVSAASAVGNVDCGASDTTGSSTFYSALKGEAFGTRFPKSNSNDQEFTISTSVNASETVDKSGWAALSPQQPAASPSTAAAAPISTEDRRKRHNANERKRTNALKTRILDMRDELSLLEKQRERLQEKGTAMVATTSSERETASAVSKEFMAIVATIDRLRGEKSQLQKQVQQWDMQNSTYQTILTEFDGTATSAKRLESSSSSAQPHAGLAGNNNADEEEGRPAMSSDDVPIFQKVLFPSPMSEADAMNCIGESYNEIKAFQSQNDFESLGGKVLGWRDKRILDRDSLQFMLAQHFESALPGELVYKTWDLLTVMEKYRQIQPRTTDLQILQRVNADCVIVRLSVGTSDKTHHTILLIARGIIDDGYLITYRSIPLSEGKQRFAEKDTEGTYVSIFNWFMFLDSRVPATGAPACEVIFGGKVKNHSAEYLRYLMMEVVAGVVRWQTAVGHSNLRLTN